MSKRVSSVKICLLDDVTQMVLLLEEMLTLRNIPFDICQNPARLFELLDAKGVPLSDEGYSFLIVGDHPFTQYSWYTVVEHARKQYPSLPILLISTEASCDEHVQHACRHNIGVLRGPFRMKELYHAIGLSR